MNPNDQAKNYDKIAEYWHGSEFDRKNGIEQHRRALRYLEKSGRGIDIGCGSSGRIIELMLEHGLETEGLDFSAEMIRIAKERHPGVGFYHADICAWNPDKKYDFISAWDSIWHVPLRQQEAALRKLCNALEDEGIIIFTSGAVDASEEASNPFHGQELYHAALGVPALLDVLRDCGCICRHLENDDWPNRHLYIIAQKNNSLNNP
jgi:SAM-dependent methyltransferase